MEAHFVVDDEQRIVQWSHATAAILGIPEGTAVGRPCYDVVRGRDPFGKDVCRFQCPAFKALQRGGLTGSCSLVVNGNRGGGRFLCKLVALPRVTGGALAALVERQPHLSLPTSGSRITTPPPSPAASAADTVQDLAALGTLATTLSPDTLDQSIEGVLDWLRQMTEAEIAELFLVEPRGGDALLTAFRGPFRPAFLQITRFPPGEGFPGLVLSQGEPIVTRDLPRDRRYLRVRVKEKGFHAYVCVPVWGSRGISGVLNVAARNPYMDLERAWRALSWVSVPLSAMLDAASLKARLNAVTGPAGALLGTPRGLPDLLRGVLRRMMAIGNACAGGLFVLDRNLGGLVQQVTEGAFDEEVCPDIRCGGAKTCPALVNGHGIALYGPRYRWPSACQSVSARDSVVHCVPLMAGEERVGIVQLRYARGGPLPPTRHLTTLLEVAEQAAQVIKQARDDLQEQAPVVALRNPLQQEQSPGVVHGRISVDHPRPGSPRPDASPVRPFLDIRCFGPFELRRQGKLVTPDMVQRRGALALLKILLIHLGRPVHRDVLVERLWPETDPQVGANRLHLLVHTLRRVVEPSPSSRRWLFIRREGDCYYFNPDAPYHLDVEEFRGYVRLGERLERQGDVRGAINAYEAAVGLYTGDFLEDDPYAEWCWEEREYLRETCLGVLRKLAVQYVEEEALDKSIWRYRRMLRLDPLREQSHQGLIRALLAAGRRDEALSQYYLCRDVLRRELDVSPLPETEELYHFALRGKVES